MKRTLCSGPCLGALIVAAQMALSSTACEERSEDRIPGPAPHNTLDKESLYGQWYVQSTVLDGPPTGAAAFPGLQASASIIRWEVQEHFLVGYRAYELVAGNDGAASDQQPVDEDHPVLSNPRALTGEVPPGTSCFDAAGGKELPCTASPAENVPVGYAGLPGVECRDPESRVIECFPYRGDPVIVFPIDSHLDSILVDGKPVEDTSRPYQDRRYIRVDWSQNLASNPTGNLGFAGRVMLGEPIIASSYVESGMPGQEDPLNLQYQGDRLDGLSMVARWMVEPDTYFYASPPFTQRIPYCLFQFGEDQPCGASEYRVRTSFRRVLESSAFEPEDMDDIGRSRFPLYEVALRERDPYRGELQSNVVYRPWRFDLWKSSWQTSEDGSFVRDEQGNRVPIPHPEREVAPVTYWLGGPWPDSAVDEAEVAIAVWDAALREAVAFRQDRDLADVPSVLHLAYNGRRKLVSVSGLEDRCAALVEAGEATTAELSDGTPACRFADYVPVRDAEFLGEDRVIEFEVYEQGQLASLGDLKHNLLYWQAVLPGPFYLYGYGPSTVDPRTGEVLQATANLYPGYLDIAATSMVDRINAMNGFLDEARVSGDVAAAVRSRRTQDDPRKNMSQARLSAPLSRASSAVLGEDAANRLSAMRAEGPSSLAASDPGAEAMRVAVQHSSVLRKSFERLSGSEGSAFAPVGYGPHDVAEWASGRPQGETLRDAAGVEPCMGDTFDQDVLEDVAQRYEDGPIEVGGPDWIELRDQLALNVLIHELGHNFGLRHNFQGSHDALNYQPEYWQLRKQNLAPLSESDVVDDFLAMSERTDEQLKGGIERFSSSSVMDYPSVWLRSSRALGRFDRAAILHSFAGAAEVFSLDPAELSEDQRALFRAAAVRPSPQYPGVTDQVHYTQLPYLLGGGDLDQGIARIGDRRLVRWNEYREELAAAAPGDAGLPLLVPFEACTDGWVFNSSHCYRWDRGADDYEISRNVVDSEAVEYFFKSYRRGEEYLQPYQVYYGHLSDFGTLQNVFGHGLAAVTEGRSDLLNELSWEAAADLGFRHAVRLATTPSYGSYLYDEPSGFYFLRDLALGQADVDIPPGIGRIEADVIDQVGSVGGYAQVDEVGHAWARLAGLQFLAMRQPIAALMGDVYRKMHVSYDMLYPAAVDRLFASMFYNDQLDFAPRLGDDGLVTFSDPREPRSVDGHPIFLSTTNEFRYASLATAYAFLRESQTLRFAEREGLVFRVGTSEEVQPPPGYVMVSFSDPASGIVWGALEPELEPGRGLAARYVHLAQGWLATYESLPNDDPYKYYWFSQVARAGDELAIMRTLYEQFANVDGVP